VTPLQEYLVKWNAINQYFLAHKLVPEDGFLRVPSHPGLGMDLDPSKIERQTEVLT
jgi:L-alanine-DL-glutamate epimerase-like enolase superfamily enzyme